MVKINAHMIDISTLLTKSVWSEIPVEETGTSLAKEVGGVDLKDVRVGFSIPCAS